MKINYLISIVLGLCPLYGLSLLLSAGILTVFGLVIRGQSVTQGSMGYDPPRYPSWDPRL